MKKFVITEEEKNRILGMHQEKGHTLSENSMMGSVAFAGGEPNGLKIKKYEFTESEDEENEDDVVYEIDVDEEDDDKDDDM